MTATMIVWMLVGFGAAKDAPPVVISQHWEQQDCLEAAVQLEKLSPRFKCVKAQIIKEKANAV